MHRLTLRSVLCRILNGLSNDVLLTRNGAEKEVPQCVVTVPKFILPRDVFMNNHFVCNERRGMNQKGNGRNNGLGQQRTRANLSSTPQGRMEREAQKASAPPPSIHPPVIEVDEVDRGIPRVLLNGKAFERGRGAFGFPDRA